MYNCELYANIMLWPNSHYLGKINKNNINNVMLSSYCVYDGDLLIYIRTYEYKKLSYEL